MNWKEITIEINVGDLENACNIANMTVPYGIYIEDYSELESEVREIANIDIIDEQLLNKDRSKALIHIYINPDNNPYEAASYLKERYESVGIGYKITLSDCEDDDWLNNWKKYFHPITVGQKILIRPTWRDDFEPNGRVVLNIDPGLAFGTGTHETTRLCLEALEKYVKPGSKILDVGCGSGILGIGALLLGAKSADGIDIDSLAVKTAKENAELNGVLDKFNILCGNLAEKASGTYDVIVANIVADAIIMLSKDIPKFMHNDTVYIMSGIIDCRVGDVRTALAENFEIIEETEEKGWFCISAKIKA